MPRQTESARAADDTESDLMSDDDFELDDFDDEEDADLDDLVEERPGARSGANVPVWRLIEMSREHRFLQRELADFEDYDMFDNATDDFYDSRVH